MDRKRPLTNDELQKYWENLDDEDPFATSDDSLKDGNFRPESNSSQSSKDTQNSEDSSDNSDDESIDAEPIPMPDVTFWNTVPNSFRPRFNVTTSRPCAILNEKISRKSDEFEVFLQVFPRSLMTFIAQCTNIRLEILRKSNEKKIDVPNTDTEKGADAPKTYYIEEVVSCLKYTFPKCREDSAFQSIDESMTKFKGRSSLKQYLPLKPIKREIKIWERCDAETGVRLMDNIPYPAVGTCIFSRKFMPKFDGKLQKSDSQFVCNNVGTLAVRWQDSKVVLVITNAVVNASILFNERRRTKKPLLQFIISLAEHLIALGKQTSAIKRKKFAGRPSNVMKLMLNVGNHLPVESNSRRRCAKCSLQGKETRIRTMCTMCKVAFCKLSFTPYHT
ncbi:hypothetical protein CBL_20664 [Carabus blaptoides fortunei]